MEKTDDSEIVASGVEEHVQIDAHSDHWYKQPGLRKLYLMMPSKSLKGSQPSDLFPKRNVSS